MNLFSRFRDEDSGASEAPARSVCEDPAETVPAQDAGDRSLAPTGTLSAETLFARVAQAARPVALGLALKGAASDFGRLQHTAALRGPDDIHLKRLFHAFETCATQAARLRDSNELVKSCVADLADALSRLGGSEGEAKHALKAIRHQIVDAKEISDLEALRQALLEHASELVVASEEREKTIQQVQSFAEERQQHARELEAALIGAEEAARTDPLTGLGNRRALDETVERTMVGPVGVLALDLDHFKAINDRFGHDGGDEVLRHLAEMLRGELRGDDRAFRVGGEELVVLLPESSWQGARATGERLRARLARHPVVMGRNLSVEVTTSIGVAMWSGSDGFDLAVKEADDALYRAKEAGRNRVVG